MASFLGPSRNVAIDTLTAASLHITLCFTLCSRPLLQTLVKNVTLNIITSKKMMAGKQKGYKTYSSNIS